VPYSRTLYYVDKGHERGLNAQLVRIPALHQQEIRQTAGKRPLTIYLPVTRDKLLGHVAAGLGDIAAATPRPKSGAGWWISSCPPTASRCASSS
jgi:hypothetical protein